MALAGDDEIGLLEAGGEADEAGDEVEAGLETGAEHEQTTAESARRRRRRGRW